MRRNNWTKNLIIMLVPAIGILLIASCDPSTDPPPPPIYQALDISLYNSPPEVDPGQNVYLAGRINDDQGEAQRGIRIYFSLSPAEIGNLTRWAWTEPDCSTGLQQQVVFNGSQIGVALITGSAVMPSGNTVYDTVSVQVREPINR